MGKRGKLFLVPPSRKGEENEEGHRGVQERIQKTGKVKREQNKVEKDKRWIERER